MESISMDYCEHAEQLQRSPSCKLAVPKTIEQQQNLCGVLLAVVLINESRYVRAVSFQVTGGLK